MEPPRVLIADDHEVVRKGLRTLLEEQPGWQVAGEACDGREAVEKARSLKPDVTVLDISMPTLNGLEATRQMMKNNPQSRVLVLTMHESDPLIREVLGAGARGYLLRATRAATSSTRSTPFAATRPSSRRASRRWSWTVTSTRKSPSPIR